MALPSSGSISLGQVNVELNRSSTATISMGEAAVRTLFAAGASGVIAMNQGLGKSNRKAVAITIASNTTNYTLNTAKAAGYAAGTTDVTLTINSGVIVYSTSTGSYALNVDTSWAAGDTITIINNGTILGKGGAGGKGYFTDGKNQNVGYAGLAGGPGLIVQRATSINNAGRISGGGGGGGGGGSGSSGALGGGGGGGIGEGAAGPGATGNPDIGLSGSPGTLTAPGAGAPARPGEKGSTSGGPGGSGGSYGAGGAAGGGSGANGGGGGGAALAGNGNITWIATGTRNGAIT